MWRPQSLYTVSRIECRIKFQQNQRCRAFLRTPLSHSPLSAAGRGCGGLVEGIAALLGSENGSRYRGVSQLQSHQSRYSVQLRTRFAAPPPFQYCSDYHRNDCDYNSIAPTIAPLPATPFTPNPNASALPNISTTFPPQTLQMGIPKSEIGMGREIPGKSGFCRISTETLGPGNSGKFILGTPFWHFGIFWGR